MRRATFLLVPTNFDDRIAYKSREKWDVLSLKMSKSAIASFFFFFVSHVFASHFIRREMTTICYLVILSFQSYKMTFIFFPLDFCHLALSRPSISIISLLM